MEAITYNGSSVMGQLSQALYSLRAEIIIFLAAFCAHALFFGKFRLLLRKDEKPAGKAKLVGGAGPDNTTQPQASAQKAKGNPLANAAEEICRARPEVVAHRLRARLQKVPEADVEKSLLALLQNAGRAPPLKLLAAVREVMKEKSMPLNTALGEVLLRGFYAGHADAEFDELLSEIESEVGKGNSPSMGVGMQALKRTLRKGDFEAALVRLEALREMWDGSESSPSAAPTALIQWLSRLALQQQSFPMLVEKLQKLGLFAEAFDDVLAECVLHRDVAIVRQLEELGQKQGVAFTRRTFCSLLKCTGGADDAMRLFSESMGKVGSDNELIAAATGAAFTHGSTVLADAILKELSMPHPADVAGKLLSVFAGQDGNAKVLELYKRHFGGVDLSSDVLAERSVSEACIRTGQFDLLESLLTTTSDCTKRVALIKHFTSESRLDDALAVFEACPEKAACLYNTIIDACIDCRQQGWIEAAQKILGEAVQAGVADIVSYNTIIKGHILAGKTQKAQETITLMKSAGLQPNCVTFNELLDACIKVNISEAWPLIDEMKASGVKPNGITCSILLKTIRPDSTSSNIERILEVLDSMSDDMDEVLLSSVIEACIRVGRVDLLLPHLKRQGSSSRVRVRGPHTYGSIIRAFGFVKDIAGAWETWREMRARSIVPTAVTLGCMVEAVTSNGDTEAAYELIQDMLRDEDCKPLVNSVIYGSVLKGFSHQKKFDRMWSVYQEMLELKLQFSIVTFNTIVDACSRSGEMSRIPELLKSMVSQGIEPNLITYSAILKGYCQENRLDEAFELVEGMVQTTKYKPDEIMYNTLLDGCARQGFYDRGMTLLKKMEGAGIHPTNFTLSVLVKLCSRGKRLDRAFEICDEFSAKYKFRLNVHVYSNLIQASIQHKDLKRAINVLERLLRERIRPDVRAYSLLLRACVSAKEAVDAAGLLRAAIGLRGVHPQLAEFAAHSLQPQGGLPTALIEEVITSIAGAPCREERLAVALLKDIRSKPNVKLDPKLHMRLTTHAAANSTR